MSAFLRTHGGFCKRYMDNHYPLRTPFVVLVEDYEQTKDVFNFLKHRFCWLSAMRLPKTIC
ncbi:MAG: hypothetical protein KTR28_01925 [Micavibrio sp.]|nr:hypothetical protein [Micavibrio sp.]